MDKYIVFKCRKCGKASYQQLTKNFKSHKDLGKYQLRCKYCFKSTSFKQSYIYKAYEKPVDAKNLMIKINNFEVMPEKEAAIYTELGIIFVDEETKKTHNTVDRQKTKANLSVISRVANIAKELKEFTQDQLFEKFKQQESDIDEVRFDKAFDNLNIRGDILKTNSRQGQPIYKLV
jgi:hypothetical protein